MGSMIGKLLLGMLMKVLAQKPLEDLTILALEKLAESTESNVDNDIVAIVKKAIKGE